MHSNIIEFDLQRHPGSFF